MSTPITTGSFAKALWPGVNAWYGKAYDEYPVEWDKLFEKHTSKRNFEQDVGVSSFGLLALKAKAHRLHTTPSNKVSLQRIGIPSSLWDSSSQRK